MVVGELVLGGVGVLIGALLLAVLACDAVFLLAVFTGEEDLALVEDFGGSLLDLAEAFLAGVGFDLAVTFGLTVTLVVAFLTVAGVFLAAFLVAAGFACLTVVFTTGCF